MSAPIPDELAEEYKEAKAVSHSTGFLGSLGLHLVLLIEQIADLKHQLAEARGQKGETAK